jgi:hypothetical protein
MIGVQGVLSQAPGPFHVGSPTVRFVCPLGAWLFFLTPRALSWGKLPTGLDRSGFGDSILDEKSDLHREPRFFRDLAEPTGTPYSTWFQKGSTFLPGPDRSMFSLAFKSLPTLVVGI